MPSDRRLEDVLELRAALADGVQLRGRQLRLFFDEQLVEGLVFARVTDPAAYQVAE